MKPMRTLLLMLLLGAAACSEDKKETPPVEPWPEAGMEDATYINNGEIQLGVDMKRGGAVFHFSEAATKRNLLNHCDEGRFMQQSYYGEADGSIWNTQPWVWNPIQGGGWQGEKAEVTDQKVEQSSLRVTTIPVHWATGKAVTECRMIESISLEGRIAHIRYSFSNRGSGAKDHPATHQEVPAIFVDWDLKNYVFYDGDKPCTGGELKSEVPGRLDLTGKNEERNRTEHWAAYVDDTGWGIGVYTPGTELSTTYRFGSGPGGPMSGACSYFAPIRTFAVTEGLSYTYDVYMMIGTVGELREAFYAIYRKEYSK